MRHRIPACADCVSPAANTWDSRVDRIEANLVDIAIGATRDNDTARRCRND
jgi:hypothetical protein